MKLNLGCGENKLPDYVNVDRHGEPDVRHALERSPWPWDDDAFKEVLAYHVLEHLGRDPEVSIGVMKALYRVCRHRATVRIRVPHPLARRFPERPDARNLPLKLSLLAFSQGYAGPLEDCATDELRSAIRAKMTRCTARGDEPGEHLDHPDRADRAYHIDREACGVAAVRSIPFRHRRDHRQRRGQHHSLAPMGGGHSGTRCGRVNL